MEIITVLYKLLYDSNFVFLCISWNFRNFKKEPIKSIKPRSVKKIYKTKNILATDKIENDEESTIRLVLFDLKALLTLTSLRIQLYTIGKEKEMKKEIRMKKGKESYKDCGNPQ